MSVWNKLKITTGGNYSHDMVDLLRQCVKTISPSENGMIDFSTVVVPETEVIHSHTKVNSNASYIYVVTFVTTDKYPQEWFTQLSIKFPQLKFKLYFFSSSLEYFGDIKSNNKNIITVIKSTHDPSPQRKLESENFWNKHFKYSVK